MNAEGAASEGFEERLVRTGEKGLQRERLDIVEESGAPDRVQMRRDLVQQQYRIWLAVGAGKSGGLSEDQVEDQRLLLAGGALRRRPAGLGVNDDEIAAMRADRRPPGRAVPCRAPAKAAARAPAMSAAAAPAAARRSHSPAKASRALGKGVALRASIAPASAWTASDRASAIRAPASAILASMAVNQAPSAGPSVSRRRRSRRARS